MTHWFRHGGLWHAVREGAKAECGLQLLELPETVTATDEDPLPPEPCRACLVQAMLAQAEEEPLEVAKARGVIPADLTLG